MFRFITLCLSVFLYAQMPVATAQTFPNQKTGVWVAKDFRFHTGEVASSLNIGYTTLGNPAGEPVVILHGTTGTGLGMLNNAFGVELFGPGQPLDATKYFVVLPDSIGTGKSSKPSDGLRAKFPRYNYDDMVSAQYRLLNEGLNIKHVRMVLGNSMGGMQTWMWGIQHAGFMDILVPMAAMPSEMSGRNWMMRRLIIDSIRNDPEWMNGDYIKQPRSLQFASVFYAIGTNGGNQALQRQASTQEKADQLLNQRLSAPFSGDANDHLYQWDASRDYNPLNQIDKIKATLLAINSADDERNPPELNVMATALTKIPNARLLLIPASDQTAGHGTTGQAKWWKDAVGTLLQTAPRLQ
jgi:homoserine O-acetyltransferase